MTADDLTTALVNSAGPEYHTAAVALAAALLDFLNGGAPSAAVQQQLAEQPQIGQLLQLLAGREIAGRDALIGFGSGQQLGELTVRDVVGGHVVHIHLPPAAPPKRKRSGRPKPVRRHQVFMSHAEENALLATALYDALRDAFAEQVDFFLAARDLQPGQRWKAELQQRLRECDAIISLLTPAAMTKPWIYFEMAPFWLADKRCYVLLTDGVEVEDLIEPLRDSQAIRLNDLNNPEQVRSLLEAIQHNAGLKGRIPQAVITQFLHDLPQALEQDRRSTFLPYLDENVPLPSDAQAVNPIIQHFLKDEDFGNLRKIAAKIQSDPIRAKLATRLIKQGHVSLAEEICAPITSTDHVREVIHCYIEHGFVDSKQIQRAIDILRARANDTEMRRLAIYLADRRHEHSETFSYVSGLMTSMAELRKIAVHFIELNRWNDEPFRIIARRVGMNNRAELRTIAQTFVRHELHHSAEFESILWVLIERTPTQAITVLEDISRADPAFLRPFRQRFAAQIEGVDEIRRWIDQWLAEPSGDAA